MQTFNGIHTFEDAGSLAAAVGEAWLKLQNLRTGFGQRFLMAGPLSATPRPLYEWVVANAHKFEGWNKFSFLLMDDQVDGTPETGFTYVPPSDKASYAGFARRHLLDPLKERLYYEGSEWMLTPDLRRLADSDRLVSEHGGIDLLILAVGVGGHYAQVMPSTSRETGFHITQLIPEIAQQHTVPGSQSYADAQFRRFGISLGPAQVVSAKNIIVMITGSGKRELAGQLLGYAQFDPQFPLSIVCDPEVAVKTRIYFSADAMPLVI